MLEFWQKNKKHAKIFAASYLNGTFFTGMNVIFQIGFRQRSQLMYIFIIINLT